MVYFLAVFWGFAEATLFFILPEVLLSLRALDRPGQALRLAGAVLAGAMVGGTVMFLWGEGDPLAARLMLTAQPAIDESLVDKTALLLREQELWGVFWGAWLGHPFKLLAAEAGYAIFTLPTFLLAFLPGRLLPALVAVLTGHVLGEVRRRLGLRVQAMRVLLLLLWGGGYLFYFL